MTPNHDDFQDLRQAFQEDFPPQHDDSQCVDQETLWDAVAGEATPERLAAIVKHTAQCPVCAENWRIAKALQSSDTYTAQVPKVTRKKPHLMFRVMPLAAVLLLSFAAFWMLRTDPAVDHDRTFRAAPIPTIESNLAPGAVLKRDDCWLRWKLSKADQKAMFELRITTSDPFDVVCETKTEALSYQIPTELLQRLSSNTPLLWQVSATLGDQSTIHSPTFTHTLE